MGFLKSLFGGSSNNNPGWMRDQGRDLFNQYGGLLDDFNPQTEVGTGMENFDRMLRNQGSAQGNKLAARGFGAASNPNYNLTRARFGANLWTNANRHALDWRKMILQGQFGMLPGLEQLYGKTQSPGLIGGLASAFGSGLGSGFGGELGKKM